MTTYKTAELIGAYLDAAVMKAHGLPYVIEINPIANPDPVRHMHVYQAREGQSNHADYKVGQLEASRDWRIGGSIIDHERIGLIPQEDGNTWLAKVADSDWIVGGTTALEAAMRAYVVAKLGEEVELL